MGRVGYEGGGGVRLGGLVVLKNSNCVFLLGEIIYCSGRLVMRCLVTWDV